MTQNLPSPSIQLPRVTLVLGGARSGKSAFAERLVLGASEAGVYVATAQGRDPEMMQRIALHKERRGPKWQTIEAHIEVVGALSSIPKTTPVLVDCLTLWLSNLMEAEIDPDRESERLVDCLNAIDGPVILVSNEVGLGIVPDNALARCFRDHAGRLNQTVAASANQVFFIAAGLAMRLK